MWQQDTLQFPAVFVSAWRHEHDRHGRSKEQILYQRPKDRRWLSHAELSRQHKKCVRQFCRAPKYVFDRVALRKIEHASVELFNVDLKLGSHLFGGSDLNANGQGVQRGTFGCGKGPTHG